MVKEGVSEWWPFSKKSFVYNVQWDVLENEVVVLRLMTGKAFRFNMKAGTVREPFYIGDWTAHQSIKHANEVYWWRRP